jgi:hypothetical protein
MDNNEAIAVHRAIRLSRITSKRAVKEAVKKEKKQVNAMDKLLSADGMGEAELLFLMKKLEEGV